MILRIIIPSLGKSPYLTETLNSLAAIQRNVNLHCYLVVPIGPDIDLTEHRWVRIVREPVAFKGGLYGAINLGCIQEGNWTHMTYINDDDGLLDSWANFEPGDADISYGRVLARYGEGCKSSEMTVCRNSNLLPGIWYWEGPGIYQQGTIISRKIYEAVGRFDDSFRLAGDHAFWLKAWEKGGKFEFSNELRAFFRLRPGQLSGNRTTMKREIVRATEASNLKVDPYTRAVGYLYWRLLSLRSMGWRAIRGLPLRMKLAG